MNKIIALALAVSTCAAPAVAQEPAQPRKVNIIIDNRGECFGGRIGSMRETGARLDAEKLMRQLRKEGVEVKVYTLSPGMERTMPGDAVRVFTSTC